MLYLPEEVEWIKFNVDMSGYYIVHYEGSGWDSIIHLLQHNHTVLSSNDRASLTNNVFQLVRWVWRRARVGGWLWGRARVRGWVCGGGRERVLGSGFRGRVRWVL